jgi:hypothetical protein
MWERDFWGYFEILAFVEDARTGNKLKASLATQLSAY